MNNPPLLPAVEARDAAGTGVAFSARHPAGDSTARIAFYFNNLLAVINGHAELLLENGGLPPEATQQVEAIYRAGEQAAAVTRQLQLISGWQAVQLAPTDVNEVVTALADVIQPQLAGRGTLDVRLTEARAVVQVDAAMLEQLVLCLATNAREAMPAGGQLRIATAVVSLSDAAAAEQPDGRSGEFVRLSVTDTGGGIAPEILPRIFEPFFSTKEVGQGVGLGLATVQAIARQSRGWVTVESAHGAGTTVAVYLPNAAPHAIAGPFARAASGAVGGKETILLVDDETPFRELMAIVLKNYGYRVLQAADATDALEVWKWHAARIDLLFTDLVMPGNLTGLELAARLRGEKPTLGIICMSGNGEELGSHGTALPTGIIILQKPCPLPTIGRAVRALLDKNQHDDEP